MKTITTDQLGLWAKGGNIGDAIYFVVIKTKNCVKCARLADLAKDMFGRMNDNVGWYTFQPGETIAAEIFAGLEIMSAPAIIYRYKDSNENNKWKLAAITGDFEKEDCDDLQCWFDAIADNDQRYFGYNELDEPVDEDAKYDMNRLLHLIHGEIDSELKAERQKFKKEVN